MNAWELEAALESDPFTTSVSRVCAMDELKSSGTNLKLYIVNSHPKHLPGEHWLAMYLPTGSPIEVFDSLGLDLHEYSPALKEFVFSRNVSFEINTRHLQGQGTCGQFCLFFAAHRCRGYSMESIINEFSADLSCNDILVKDFVRKHYL